MRDRIEVIASLQQAFLAKNIKFRWVIFDILTSYNDQEYFRSDFHFCSSSFFFSSQSSNYFRSGSGSCA